MENFHEFEFDNNGKSLSYYLYYGEGKVKSLIVYVHGLMSDFFWFKMPYNLPKNAAVVFMQRQPKADVEDFMEWIDNYNACLKNIGEKIEPDFIHLVANCFGCYQSLVWATLYPETFTTVTLSNPPVVQKKGYKLFEMIDILKNKDKKHWRKIFLDITDFSRIPESVKFIETTPDTSFEFTDRFLFQVLKMQKWLNKNFLGLSAPVQAVFATEDKVVEISNIQKGFWGKIEYENISYFICDHYIELSPQRNLFWDKIIDFHQKYELDLSLESGIKTVLVTGATGFLGQHIVRSLLDKYDKVICFVRDKEKAKNIFGASFGRLDIRVGDIENAQSLEDACKNCDAVIHALGLVGDWGEWSDYYKINVEGTKNILFAAHHSGVKQFVLIGSLGVYGDTDQNNIDENAQLQTCSDYYSNSKILQENFVKRYCAQNSLPYTIVRPGFIYGEGDNNFMPKLLTNLSKGKFKFIGDGTNHLNTVYVGNVANLISKIVGNENSFNQSYNLADPKQTPVKQFISDVVEGLDLNMPTKHVPIKMVLAITTILESSFRLFKSKKAPPFTRKKVTFIARDRLINSTKSYDLMGDDFYSYAEGMEKTLQALKRKKR